MAYNRGHQNVVIETVAQQLVTIWSSSSYERSEVTVIMHEVLELSLKIASFRLNYVPREANELAHLCAKPPDRRRCLWINLYPNLP